MCCISHLWIIAIVVFGLKLQLSESDSLTNDDITAIIILCLYVVHAILLGTYASIAIIWTRSQKHLKLGAYSWQLLACTIVTLMMSSMAGLFCYFAKKQTIDQLTEVLLIIGSLLFLIISLIIILVTLSYLARLRKINVACMKFLKFEKLTEKNEKMFDSLPSLTFTENLYLKINKWAICREEFCIDDILKVIPGCFHVFHAYCFLGWYLEHETWPVNNRRIESKDFSKTINISEQELAMIIRPS